MRSPNNFLPWRSRPRRRSRRSSRRATEERVSVAGEFAFGRGLTFDADFGCAPGRRASRPMNDALWQDVAQRIAALPQMRGAFAPSGPEVPRPARARRTGVITLTTARRAAAYAIALTAAFVLGYLAAV
jgi:hypothetical protein